MRIDSVDAAIAISKAIELFLEDDPRNIKTIKVVVFDPEILDLFRTVIAPGMGNLVHYLLSIVSLWCHKHGISFVWS